MKILPPRTLPPDAPIPRRHKPAAASHWSSFRACVRWDFGFTCAFCLLHESDFFGEAGGEGLAATTIEHRDPRSAEPGRATEYGNCLYACRLCNRARSTLPVQMGERRLLDPTHDSWARHFELAADRLEPAAGDDDAEYTHRTYDLDDPRKVERRRIRRLLVTDRLRLLRRFPAEITALLRLADGLRTTDLPNFRHAILALKSLRQQALKALSDLSRFPAVPADAPRACRCPGEPDLSLPEWLASQVLDSDLELPLS